MPLRYPFRHLYNIAGISKGLPIFWPDRRLDSSFTIHYVVPVGVAAFTTTTYVYSQTACGVNFFKPEV